MVWSIAGQVVGWHRASPKRLEFARSMVLVDPMMRKKFGFFQDSFVESPSLWMLTPFHTPVYGCVGDILLRVRHLLEIEDFSGCSDSWSGVRVC